MKKALVVALGSVLLAGGAVAGHVFLVTEGIYEPTTIYQLNTEQACKFGDAQVYKPLADIHASQPEGYLETLLHPDTEEPIAGYIDIPCTLDGRHVDCEWPHSSDVIDFTAFGFDAIIYLDTYSWGDTVWVTSSKRLEWGGADWTCEGTQCDLVAGFFGPEFSTPCSQFEITKSTLRN